VALTTPHDEPVGTADGRATMTDGQSVEGQADWREGVRAGGMVREAGDDAARGAN